MIRESIALILALTLIALAFGVLRLWQRRQPPPSAELVRKGAHISTGVLAAAFPWLFQATWSGLTLCLLALLAMIAMRVIPALRRTLGQVAGSVERRSWGELYFPVGVACVWVFSAREPVLFVVPVLVLTLGDAAAALVGTCFSRHKFRTTEGHKSVEGSLAFLCVSTAVAFIALIALVPGMDLTKAVLVAALLACLLMIFEAIAWRGLDNLLLPVMAFVLLRIYLNLEPAQLAVRLGVISLILVLLVATRRRRTLTGEGVLAASLFLHTAWALGGWPWLAPPAIVILSAPWLPRSASVPSITIHGVFPVIALSAAGLVLLLVHELHGADVWLPYVATFSAALSMVACIQLHADLHRVPSIGVVMISLLVGIVLVVLPAVLIAGLSLSGARALLVITLATSVIACGCAFVPALNRLAGENRLWLLRGIALSIGSACAAGLNTVAATLP